MKTTILAILAGLLPGLIETAESNFADGATKKQWVTSTATDVLETVAPELGVQESSIQNAIGGLTDIVVALKNDFGWGKSTATEPAQAQVKVATPAAQTKVAAQSNPQQPAASASPASGESSSQSPAASTQSASQQSASKAASISVV